MVGKLNLRVLHGGAATLHSIRVMQPKQVSIETLIQLPPHTWGVTQTINVLTLILFNFVSMNSAFHNTSHSLPEYTFFAS
jgi:hypothetical protein